jgi:hypothetical protein
MKLKINTFFVLASMILTACERRKAMAKQQTTASRLFLRRLLRGLANLFYLR